MKPPIYGVMAEFDIFHIIGNCVESLRHNAFRVAELFTKLCFLQQ